MFSLCNILNYFPCMQSNWLGLFVYSVFLPFWQVSFSVCALVIDCCNCCLHIKRITHLLQVLTVFPYMFSICFLTCHKALLFSSSICRTLVSSFFLANFSSWPVSGPCFSLPIQFSLHLAVPNDSFVKYIYSPLDLSWEDHGHFLSSCFFLFLQAVEQRHSLFHPFIRIATLRLFCSYSVIPISTRFSTMVCHVFDVRWYTGPKIRE